MKTRIAFLFMAMAVATECDAGPLDGSWSTRQLTLTFYSEAGKIAHHSNGGSAKWFEVQPFTGSRVQWTESVGGTVKVYTAERQGDKVAVSVNSGDGSDHSHDEHFILFGLHPNR